VPATVVKPLIANLLKASISAGRNVPPAVIRAAIQIEYGSVAELAKRKNISPDLLYAAISRPQPSGNKIIADALGCTLHRLWPLWFTSTGRRVRAASNANTGSEKAARGRQKAVSA